MGFAPQVTQGVLGCILPKLARQNQDIILAPGSHAQVSVPPEDSLATSEHYELSARERELATANTTPESGSRDRETALEEASIVPDGLKATLMT